MPRLTTLLSNGTYHVVLMANGAGYSRWRDLAVTRWREDAALDGAGTFLYLHDGAESGVLWSATQQPTVAGNVGSAAFTRGQAVFSQRQHEIDCSTTVAVAHDSDVELRRYRVTNHSASPRTLHATTLAEIVLAPPATDAAHQAFSKLFIQTQIDAARHTIVATRRPSKQQDERVWLIHCAVLQGADAAWSFETSRPHFIGRGRSAANPQALQPGAALAGHDGPVLDAVAAIQMRFTLAPGGSCTIDAFTGIAGTRPDCDALADKLAAAGAGDHIVGQQTQARDALLKRLGASDDDARRFEQLAGAILQSSAALRAPADAVAANHRGQPSLWGFGISGDVPVVLLQLDDSAQLPLARQLVQAHAFWAANGLKTEMMLLAATAALAEQLQAQLASAIGTDRLGKRDGIFIRARPSLDDADHTLLKAVARVVLDGAAGTLAEQIDGAQAEAPAAASAPAAPPGARDAVATPPQARPTTNLVAFNGHGGFTPDLREYVIHTAADHMTPAPWCNVVANPDFGTLVSDSGSATTWCDNAHEYRLTRWANDPVSDPSAEALYIRDDDSQQFWSPTLLPTASPGPHVVRHGFGYSVFNHTQHGIASELCVFVAMDAPVKFSVLTLRNRSDRARRLSVTGYVEWVLGDDRDKTLMHVVTERDAATGAVFARNAYNTDFPQHTAFFDVQGDSWSACGDRGDFFGSGGSLARPAALKQAQLSGRLGAALDPCAALRVSVELAAGAEQEVIFRLGAGKTQAHASELVQRWRGTQAAQHALAAVRAHWQTTLGAVQVHTPDTTVDALANGWLLYQVINSRLWGRTGFYQSSGAYGFRDQLQDVMALVHAAPALVREHLLRSAARQFPQGDVQHWWHPPSGKGIRTRCSDDYLWLPFVASRYVSVTGDVAVLDTVCPFIEADPLEAGKESAYGLPKVSELTANLYEHCVRAIRNGLHYGAHGLPLIGHGDWNDGMNLVGAEGKGESVWLAFFLITVLKRFAPLAHGRGDIDFADLCEREATTLAKNVEASSWDGAWYRRAFFDDGTPLGSAGNTECQIDAIAQSWAVISGAAPKDRAQQAMESAHTRLVRQDTRLIQLLDPPFDTSTPWPGYIAGYVPGVRENGGQYTHGATWMVLAFAALGDAERAWEAFNFLNPIHHGSSAEAIATYKVEPYVVAGDVYAFKPHAGRGGWTWYSGSAGWMYQVLVESLLGLQRLGSTLRVRPLLPRDWPGFEMRYRHGSSTYAIACREAKSADAAATSVDGKAVADGVIELLDDGQTHQVTVHVWRAPPTARGA